jgi:hypothetical protein
MTDEQQAPSRAPALFRVQPFGSPMPMVPPRPIAANLARSMIGPDDPAAAVGIIVVWIIIRRCVVEPPMEVMMPVEIGPVGVAVSAMMKSMEAAVTIAAAVNRSESAAVKTATAKTVAMKVATMEATAMESPPWPPPPPPCRTTVVSPSAACFAAGTAAGLASDSARHVAIQLRARRSPRLRRRGGEPRRIQDCSSLIPPGNGRQRSCRASSSLRRVHCGRSHRDVRDNDLNAL